MADSRAGYAGAVPAVRALRLTEMDGELTNRHASRGSRQWDLPHVRAVGLS